ncbi:unnamed protein product [Durusdinium trenchii]
MTSEADKKIRSLEKKLREIKKLQERLDSGEQLEKLQLDKIAKQKDVEEQLIFLQKEESEPPGPTPVKSSGAKEMPAGRASIPNPTSKASARSAASEAAGSGAGGSGARGGYMDTHLEDAICLGNQRKDEVEQTRRYKYLRSPMAQQWKEEFVGVFEVHPPDTTPETKDHSKWMTFTEPFEFYLWESQNIPVDHLKKTIHKATSVKKSDFSLQTMTSERQKLPWDADAVVEFRKLVQKGLSSSEVEKKPVVRIQAVPNGS